MIGGRGWRSGCGIGNRGVGGHGSGTLRLLIAAAATAARCAVCVGPYLVLKALRCLLVSFCRLDPAVLATISSLLPCNVLSLTTATTPTHNQQAREGNHHQQSWMGSCGASCCRCVFVRQTILMRWLCVMRA